MKEAHLHSSLESNLTPVYDVGSGTLPSPSLLPRCTDPPGRCSPSQCPKENFPCLWPDRLFIVGEGRSRPAEWAVQALLALSTKRVLLTAHFQSSECNLSSLKRFPLANILACSGGWGWAKEKQEQESFSCFKPQGALDISLTITHSKL